MDDASGDGVIYFSFGSCIRSIDLPEKKLKAFIETFRLLPHRVIWKFENDTLDNLPPNVLIKKWLPQNDILAHKNVKLFITHGGIFGTQEGVYHGVPMLFIPIYSDQFRNAKRCVDAGYAELLQFVDVTPTNVVAKVTKILGNRKYAQRVQQVSTLFRDNPIDQMDEAMYWIEYTARHRGTNIFKSNGSNLPWYIHMHLDIVAAIIGAVVALRCVMASLKRITKQHSPNPNISKNKQKMR